MAAKKRKPAFDIPASGQSDAGWVQRSDEGAAQPSAAPSPSETYTRAPVVGSGPRLEDNEMEATNTGAQTPGTLLVNGVKVLGEVGVVPGASLIVDGEVKSGIVHAAGGLIGLAVLGPVLGPLAWLAVGADSYSRSVSGKSIVDQFSKKSKLAV